MPLWGREHMSNHCPFLGEGHYLAHSCFKSPDPLGFCVPPLVLGWLLGSRSVLEEAAEPLWAGADLQRWWLGNLGVGMGTRVGLGVGGKQKLDAGLIRRSHLFPSNWGSL